MIKKTKVVIPNQTNFIKDLLNNLDEKDFENLDFDGMENLVVDITQELGSEILASMVKKKEGKLPPKNLKISKTSEHKKKH